ncbi:MAG: molecular chaperone HtpG [Rhodobacteraceae bacterium]|nr:MAG: molecular chaperone HtpG [Paracoccaceae bacterium]
MKKSFEADTGRVLNIVINSLYSEKEIFLRELISNSSDALDKRRFLSLTDSSLGAENSEYKISIMIDKKNKSLTISDNGIGMDEEDLIKSLGTIARSGTSEFLAELEKKASEKKDADVNLIGQFGVGFYSSFMVADNVVVISRKAGSHDCFKWSSDGTTGYEIEKLDNAEVGTTITLTVKAAAKEFLDETRLSFITKKYSDHISYPIDFSAGVGKEKKTINSASALWTRDKKDITPDQYNEFFRHIGAGYGEPFLTIHSKAEGTVSYTNLLFIPDKRPFDLFTAERNSKLKLYANRVFITDNCEDILPKWLRFVYGIIDTPDLDLNVSREMLQHNPALKRISKSLIKKVINELKKIKEKDGQKYDLFWKEFGQAFKEGIYEDADNKKNILALSKFYSSKSDDTIFLSDYLEGMHKNQEAIFYISSDTLDRAKTSPHLEGLKAKGIEVLFFVDPIDTFWLQMLPEFEEKKFTSITKGTIDLSKFDNEVKNKKKSDDNEKKAEKPDFSKLIERIKAELGENVSDVRLSNKLVDSPSCLVADEVGMDVQMERIMKMHDKDFAGAPRILELNENHEVILQLNKMPDKKKELIKDASFLLFDQAKIMEGQMPVDLGGFTRRLTQFMSGALK